MKINIGGLQKFSLSDYPGKVAAIIFLRGCNFRCSYCHNTELFDTKRSSMPLEDTFNFLKKRKSRLDGVVITGGEPTLYVGLPLFLEKIKSLDYSIKLNTNGSYPNRLNTLIRKSLLDYIAMDIKAPLEKYNMICQRKVEVCSIQRSIELITKSDIAHEFRTTVDSTLLSRDDMQKIRSLIPASSPHYINKAL